MRSIWLALQLLVLLSIVRWFDVEHGPLYAIGAMCALWPLGWMAVHRWWFR